MPSELNQRPSEPIKGTIPHARLQLLAAPALRELTKHKREPFGQVGGAHLPSACPQQARTQHALRLHTDCTQIALRLHSDCTQIALRLHSDCTLSVQIGSAYALELLRRCEAQVDEILRHRVVVLGVHVCDELDQGVL